MSKNMSNFRKPLLISLGAIAAILLIAFIVIQQAYKPTPDDKRNISTSDVVMNMDVSDSSGRVPIIRTYTLEEFEKMTEKELVEAKDTVNGRVEGDAPANNFDEGKNQINFTFYKNDKKVKPSSNPIIKLEIYPDQLMPYTNNPPYERRDIESELEEDEEGTYSFNMKRYVPQTMKYVTQLSFMEIYFEIDGQKYVGLTSLNTSNTEDGTDFFDNEELDTPIPPEE